MLFAHQVKKEFQPITWKKGQDLFRDDKVGDVRLKQNLVVSRVREQEAVRTSILMGRSGAIQTSSCSCTAHGAYEKHCRHVAALASWILEKGSLLRAGVIEGNGRKSILISGPSQATSLNQKPARHSVAEPVALVRGIFKGRVLEAVTVEAALRFQDPKTPGSQVLTLFQLIKREPLLYKTTDELYLKVLHDFIPVIHSIDAPKVTYQGASMFEHMAKLLSHQHKAQIVFHENLTIKFDSTPLKLTALHIGEASQHGRRMTYQFKNERINLNSIDLEQLHALGRLSSNYALVNDTLVRFETALQTISQFANRSGSSHIEGGKKGSRDGSPLGFTFLDDDNEAPLHPLSVYRLSLELGVDELTVDKNWKEFFDWKKTFEREKIPTLPTVDYGFELRDYQKNGVSWVWSLYHRGLAALLADDMGLGKTHQVLAVLSSFYRTKNKPSAPTLVVAPTSVVSAWVQKLQKYPTELNWSVFHGKSRVLPGQDAEIVLTTYGILQREASLREREWHCVVLDEAQAIKNAITISSRASRVLKSKFRIAMTGTPIENHATDLWSIMEFLLPGYLGPLPRFKRLYSTNKEHVDPAQTHALKRLISPFLLRRTKSQVLTELPEKTEEVISCELTPSQKKAYKSYLESAEVVRVRDDLAAGKKINYANILSCLTRLKQVCDHPLLPELSGDKVRSLVQMDPWESGKWGAFEELLKEALGSNLKVVIFTQYLAIMDLIGLWLKDQNIEYIELRGDTTDRHERITQFAAEPEKKIFLCSLLAGSLGIDLTAASVCIHFDRWWNPARENQATDRLHRIGQTRGVQVFKLQIPGTIEERIAKIIHNKRQLSDALIETSALGLKAFSREDLMELLTVPKFEDSETT